MVTLVTALSEFNVVVIQESYISSNAVADLHCIETEDSNCTDINDELCIAVTDLNEKKERELRRNLPQWVKFEAV